ncbi:MAG: cell division protein SepF [Actinomycetota bacterium]
MGIVKNALIYLGFVEDELQEEMNSYDDAPRRRSSVGAREARDSFEDDLREPREQRSSRHPREQLESRPRMVSQEPPLASVHPISARQVPMGQVHLVRPASYGDAQEIGDRLRRNLPVIVNLEEAEEDLYKRVVAFASGLVYGLDGHIQKLAKRIYLITPADMLVSSEDKRRLREDSGLAH